MSRRPQRRGRRTVWPLLAACALSAASSAGAAAPADDHTAERVPVSDRVPVVHIDPDPDPVQVGGSVTVRALLANHGPDRTASPLTVTVVLPENTTAAGSFFPGTCLADSAGVTITCTFPAGLGVHRTAVVIIPARISASAPPSSRLDGGKVTVANTDDPDAKVRTVKFAIRTA